MCTLLARLLFISLTLLLLLLGRGLASGDEAKDELSSGLLCFSEEHGTIEHMKDDHDCIINSNATSPTIWRCDSKETCCIMTNVVGAQPQQGKLPSLTLSLSPAAPSRPGGESQQLKFTVSLGTVFKGLSLNGLDLEATKVFQPEVIWTSPEQNLVLEDCEVLVPWSDLEKQAGQMCNEPGLPKGSRVKIYDTRIEVEYLNLAEQGIKYINTTFIPSNPTNQGPLHCQGTVRTGADLLRLLPRMAEISDRVAVVFDVGEEDVEFDEDTFPSEPYVIKSKVNISGQEGAWPHVLLPNKRLFDIGDGGRLSLSRLEFKSPQPASPLHSAAGVMTLLLWAFGFDRGTANAPSRSNCWEGVCLQFSVSELYVPTSEFKYLRDLLPDFDPSPWNGDSVFGAAKDLRMASKDNGEKLTLEIGSLLAADGSWSFESVVVAGRGLETPTVGIPLMDPYINDPEEGDSPSAVPVEVMYKAIPVSDNGDGAVASLPISFFQTPAQGVQVDGATAAGGDAGSRLLGLVQQGPKKYILPSDVQLVDESGSGKVVVESDIEVLGDPFQPGKRVISLSRLTSVTAPRNARGLITVAKGSTLTFRSVSFTDLGPSALPKTAPPTERRTRRGRNMRSGYDGDKPDDSDGTSTNSEDTVSDGTDNKNNYIDVGDFSSALWIFREDDWEPNSQGGGAGTVQLLDVELVLPQWEFDMLVAFDQMRSEMDACSKLKISEKLCRMIRGIVERSEVSVWSGWKSPPTRRRRMRRGLRQSSPADAPPTQAAPTSISFRRLNFSGIAGQNVTLRPREVEEPSEIFRRPSSPNTPMKPVLPRKPRGPIVAPPYRPPRAHIETPDEAELATWEIGVIVAGSVLGISVLTLFVFFMVKRYRRRGQMHNEPRSSTSSDLGAASIGGEGGTGLVVGGKGALYGLAGPGTFGSSEMTDGQNTAQLAAANTTMQHTNGTRERIGTGELMSEIFRSEDFGSIAQDGQAGYSMSVTNASIDSAAPGLGESGPPGGHFSGSMSQQNLRIAMQHQLNALQNDVGEEESQWEVHSQLGKGAYGVVYKGTWRGLEVAIKRVIFQLLRGAEGDASRQAALREAAINATLNHPNIVTTYSYDMKPLGGEQQSNPSSRQRGGGLRDWQLYIIQEYCEAGSLFDAIQSRRFYNEATKVAHLDNVLAIAENVAAGMAYIHSRNIIHGDLKPDNVLLKHRPIASNTPSKAGTGAVQSVGARMSTSTSSSAASAGPGLECVAKVADFGMSAKMQGNQTHISGVHHGTPLYIAPEILQSGKASKAADVYSFGIILWELFFGLSAWEHLVKTAGTMPKGRSACYFPGLFSFEDCSMPAYAQLGRRCIAESATDRPSFVAIVKAIQTMRMSDPTQLEPSAINGILSVGRLGPAGDEPCSPTTVPMVLPNSGGLGAGTKLAETPIHEEATPTPNAAEAELQHQAN